MNPAICFTHEIQKKTLARGKYIFFLVVAKENDYKSSSIINFHIYWFVFHSLDF